MTEWRESAVGVGARDRFFWSRLDLDLLKTGQGQQRKVQPSNGNGFRKSMNNNSDQMTKSGSFLELRSPEAVKMRRFVVDLTDQCQRSASGSIQGLYSKEISELNKWFLSFISKFNPKLMKQGQFYSLIGVCHDDFCCCATMRSMAFRSIRQIGIHRSSVLQ